MKSHLYFFKFITLCLLGFIAPGKAFAMPFNINLTFTGTPTQTQRNIFENSASLWESLITGYQVNTGIGAVDISVDISPIDGVNGVLGQARPTFITRAGGFAFTTQGEMTFDSADIAIFEGRGLLDDIATHEIGHVLGFGTLWSIAGAQQLYTPGTGQYIGAYGLAEYQREFDPTATFIPVDIVSGPGTRDGHWDENWAGGPNELMTGFLSNSSFLSRTSIASFADLGYTTVVTHPVPVPASAPLLVGGLGALVWLSRRRKAEAIKAKAICE